MKRLSQNKHKFNLGIIFFCCITLFSTICVASNDKVLRVGPRAEFAKPSDAAKHARNGDIIEIEANGDYTGDEVIWRRNNLIIRGVNGRPKLQALGNIKNRKGIWVLKGNNITVENFEFSNAKVRDHNGAGIRILGRNATIRHCYFHDNENGILGGRKPKSDLLVEYSEFSHNGYGDGKTHNIYIGKLRNFTFRYNYSHDARVGHNLKSRAQNNYILYNRIMDEKSGTSSYEVDLPNGGFSVLMGNIIQQGPAAENWTIISYGAERLRNPSKEIYLVNNTVVNTRKNGLFLKLKKGAQAFVYNNIFAGPGKLSRIALTEKNNLRLKDLTSFIDAGHFDYHLKASSKAIDAGALLGKVNGVSLVPAFEYRHPAGKRKRQILNKIDIGAFEFHPQKK